MGRSCSGERRYFIFQHRLADGQVRDVEVYSGPVTVAGKTLLYSIVFDVTERKRAEEDRERLLTEVQHRAAELQAIITSIADGLIVYDPEEHIVTANPAAERLLGPSPEEWDIPFSERWKVRQVFLPDGQAVPTRRLTPASGIAW